MSFGGLFGGGGSAPSSETQTDNDSGDYEVATEEDMEWLSKIL